MSSQILILPKYSEFLEADLCGLIYTVPIHLPKYYTIF